MERKLHPNNLTFGFIGCGNMGSAIIKGYAGEAKRCGNSLLVCNRTRAKADSLSAEVPGLRVTDTIGELVGASDVVFVCVEPKNFAEVMPEIAESFTSDNILVSIAAGIDIAYLESYLPEGAKVVRTMPNTPIMHGCGATSISRNSNVSDDDLEIVEAVFKAGGIVGEIPEDLIPAVIGVSGSSPAYSYMYMDALIKAGIENGLDPEMSKEFAAQAVMGAALMLLNSSDSPAGLCARVCTPGGTTIEAVNYLKDKEFEELVKKAAQAAMNRAASM